MSHGQIFTAAWAASALTLLFIHQDWPSAVVAVAAGLVHFGVVWREHKGETDNAETAQELKRLKDKVDAIAIARGLGRG